MGTNSQTRSLARCVNRAGQREKDWCGSYDRAFKIEPMHPPRTDLLAQGRGTRHSDRKNPMDATDLGTRSVFLGGYQRVSS